MTDPIAFDADILDQIQDVMNVSLTDPQLPWTVGDFNRYADFIAGNQPELKNDALDNVTRRYAKELDYHLRGAWRAGYDYVHVYEAGPELAQPEFTDTFVFHRDYIASNDPPDAGRYREYKFSYDLTAVPDDVIRTATSRMDSKRPHVSVTAFEAE